MLLESPTRYIAPKEKILHHHDLIGNVLQGQPRVPRHFELDPTNRCNLACEGCHFAYVHEDVGRSADDMSEALFRKIAEDMYQNEVKAITFTGGGEPLFNRDHLKFFGIADDFGLEMGLYTNGVLLSGTTAEFVAAKFKWCYVSLDATTPEEYSSYKGKKGRVIFDTNWKNIANIVAQKNRTATIGVGYLVGPQNIDRVEEAVTSLLELGTDYVQLRPIVDVGNYAEQRMKRRMLGLAFASTEEEWKQHYSWIPQALVALDRLEGTPRLNSSRDKFTDLYEGKRKYPTCLSTSLTGCIGAHGEVWMCVNHRGNPDMRLGDLKSQTLQEIFLPKPIAVENLSSCRLNCRNDRLNQALWGIVQNPTDLPIPLPNISHINFV